LARGWRYVCCDRMSLRFTTKVRLYQFDSNRCAFNRSRSSLQLARCASTMVQSRKQKFEAWPMIGDGTLTWKPVGSSSRERGQRVGHALLLALPMTEMPRRPLCLPRETTGRRHGCANSDSPPKPFKKQKLAAELAAARNKQGLVLRY
jgi:hypothetical protein